MLQKVKKWSTFPVAALTILGLVFASGCGAGAGEGAPAQGEKLSGKITVAGSTSVLPLVKEFAEAFMEKHPEVEVTTGGGGSGAGVMQCGEGMVDIGATSRYLKPTEHDLISYPIARDGVAIVVHKNNPISGLSIKEVAKIYAGEIKDWGEVGGKGKIRVYCREEGSGTREVFAERVMKPNDKEITGDAIFKKSNAEMQRAIQDDPSGIAFVSLGYVQGTKVLKLNGVKCSPETCKKGEYPIVRRLYFHTKNVPTKLEKEFIKFCRSSEGQKIVEEMGYIRLRK